MLTDEDVKSVRKIFTEMKSKIILPAKMLGVEDMDPVTKLIVDVSILMPRFEVVVNGSGQEYSMYLKYLTCEDLTILISDKFDKWSELVRNLSRIHIILVSRYLRKAYGSKIVRCLTNHSQPVHHAPYSKDRRSRPH